MSLIERVRAEFQKAPLAMLLSIVAVGISMFGLFQSVRPIEPKISVVEIFGQQDSPEFPSAYTTNLAVKNLSTIDAEVLAWMILLDQEKKVIPITNADKGETSSRFTADRGMGVTLKATSDVRPAYVIVCLKSESATSWAKQEHRAAYSILGTADAASGITKYQREQNGVFAREFSQCVAGLAS